MPSVIRKISKNKFNAFVGMIRSENNLLFINCKEIAWFASSDNTHLSVIMLDLIDKDYNAVILCRDLDKKFRAINVKTNFTSIEPATEYITKVFRERTKTHQQVFIQGDENNNLKNIFKIIVKKEKLHPYFIILKDTPSYSAAKEMINEIMPHYRDIDGNFIEQFQSTGFDQRIWELYLFCYLKEEGLYLDRSHYAPDFIVKTGLSEIAIEAVTVARTGMPSPDIISNKPPLDMEKEINDMSLKFGSTLYSKLQHTEKATQNHYWELPHVENKPFIIAIHDFHDDLSMIWSHPILMSYLYGIRQKWEKINGELHIYPEIIDHYIKPNGVKISPAFFDLENSQYISAILSTSQGTLPKFNRMGKQAGFGTNDIALLKYANHYNRDPNSTVPIFSSNLVNENGTETWGEGVSIYHNPKALYSLDPSVFPNAAHHFLGDDLLFESFIPENYTFNSFTLCVFLENNKL